MRSTTAAVMISQVLRAPSTFTPLIAIFVGLLLASAPGAAAKREKRVFEEATRVVEVEVPVNVVSRDGHPLRGLKAEDFEVYDQGREQEIVGFRVVDLESWQPRRLGGQDDQLPSAARRHLLLLFDLSFASPSSTVKAQRAARELVLSSLHPTDLAAVATYSLELGPRMVVTFTPDRAQLAHAIDTLGLRRRDARFSDPLRFVLAPPDSLEALAQSGDQTMTGGTTRSEAAVAEAIRVHAKQMEKSRRSQEGSKVTAFSRSLADLARAMDSVRGRKQVVLFSEGFDSRLFLGRRPDSQDADQRLSQLEMQRGELWMVDSDELYGSTGLQNDLQEMLEAFRRADCTIQAVDISGLRADFVRQTDTTGGQEALFYLANETGGELFEDANDLEAQLERVLERTSVTYILTFRPSEVAWDGSFHRLKVRAALPEGARLSHRKGYFAPRPFADLDPLEKSLLAADDIASAVPRGEIDLSLLVAPFRSGEEAAYVPVIVEIGGEGLLRHHEGERLTAEIFAYVTNDRGEMRDFFTQQVTLDTSAGREALASTGLKYYGHFTLTPGEHRARVLVRNSSTGNTGIQTAAFLVPDYTEGAPTLLPPFFLESPGQWVLLREEDRGDDGTGSVIYPFTVNGQPFIPAAKPSLRSHDEAQLCLIAYNLDRGELALESRIVSADGTPAEAGARIELVERTVTGIEGLDKLLAAFHTSGLARGDYRLEVAVRDATTEGTRFNAIAFAVRD